MGSRCSVSLLSLIVVSLAATAADSWVGKDIIVKRAGIMFGQIDSKTGEPIATTKLEQLDYKVMGEKDGLIRPLFSPAAPDDLAQTDIRQENGGPPLHENCGMDSPQHLFGSFIKPHTLSNSPKALAQLSFSADSKLGNLPFHRLPIFLSRQRINYTPAAIPTDCESGVF